MPADSKDVTMADVEINVEDEKTGKGLNVVQAINVEVQTIHQATASIDIRALSRVQVAAIKRLLTPGILKRCITVFVHESEPIRDSMTLLLAEVEKSSGSSKGSTPSAAVEKTFASELKNTDSKLPEVAFFFAICVLDVIMLPKNKITQATREKFISNLLMRLSNLNTRRTIDFFGSRVYACFARIFKDSELIRNDLLAIYRTACLQRDASTQGTVLNLILRNYLAHNLFEQAQQLVNKTTFPETRTNAEYARYLFYIGRIKSIQLEYGDAHTKLMQAIRKAPQTEGKALGFKVIAWKFALIVELLMGEVPERKHFLVPEYRKYLEPYQDVTKAVRGGSIPEFEKIVKKYESLFKADGTLTLVSRLRYNVIKTGLRKINVSYSRISLQDIAAKLGLDSAEGAAGICAKAISDGVIHATLDYDNACLLSKANRDIYSTLEPKEQLNKRIAYCLQLHSDCVKSMEYPSHQDAPAEDVDPTRDNRERDEIIKEVEEEDIDML